MSTGKYSENVKSEMLSYLETKYGEKFIVTEFTPSGNGFNRAVYDEAYVYPESDPAKVFAVQRRKEEGNDKYTLRDGYALRHVEDILKVKINEMGNKIFGGCKAEITADELDHVTDGTYNMKDELDTILQKETALDIGITLAVSYSGEFDINKHAEDVYSFMNEMLNNKYHGSIYFVFVDAQKYDELKLPMFKDLDTEKLHELYGVKYVTYSDILNYKPYKDTKEDIIERFNTYYKTFEEYDKKSNKNANE